MELRRPPSRRAPWCLLVLAGGLAFGQAGPLPAELWVLAESEQIFVVDPQTLAVAPPIGLADPTVSGTPACLAFSTVSGQPPVALVGQGRFLRRVDVTSRTVLSPPTDVAALLGVGDLTLGACAAGIPREFASAGGPAIRAHLHLAGRLPSGEARWVVLDQQALLAGSPGALVASGTLHANAVPLDVRVLQTPHGDRFERAWHALAVPGATAHDLLAVPLSLGRTLGALPVTGAAQRFGLSAGDRLPDVLGLGAPVERELPVFPTWSLGGLVNLDTQDSCALGGDLAIVSVSGPGPNSYTVLALDPLADQLVIVDANDCSVRTVAVGQRPVDVIPRGLYAWRGAFVVNRDSDSLTFVDEDQIPTTVPLAVGSRPVQGGMTQQLVCGVVGLEEDIVGNDVQLSWTPLACPPGKEYFVWCSCIEDPFNCDCSCDCDAPMPNENCACPANADPDPLRGGGGFLLNYPPGDDFSKNPWLKLGSTTESEFTHAGQAQDSPSVDYAVTVSDEPPPP